MLLECARRLLVFWATFKYLHPITIALLCSCTTTTIHVIRHIGSTTKESFVKGICSEKETSKEKFRQTARVKWFYYDYKERQQKECKCVNY